MEKLIDDSTNRLEFAIVEEKGRARRVNGRTNYELLRDYYDSYGEEEYVAFLLSEKMVNPKGIKIKDPNLAEEIKKAGLQA